MRARPAQDTLPIPYREDIHHPAMATPLVTRGQFDLIRGDLVRHQSQPKKETTEIGTRFITIRRENYENTVLIPSRLAPLLAVLREIVVGGADQALEAYTRELTTTETGWTVTLTPKDEGGGVLALSGCGEVLRDIRFDLDGGERRVITFVPSE